jgi:N-acetylneuraminic acid mutarotase
VRPETVQVGQTLILEGVFGATATVSFTGASPVAATVLGTQRAIVTVPIGASSGNVTVTTRGVTTTPQRVRVTTFALTLNNFRKSYEQAGYGEQTPTPLEARVGAMAFRAGHWLYLLGGSVAGTPTSTIERALINGDGSLGPFQAAGNLTASRAFAAAMRVGDKLVVTGGASGAANTPVSSIEEATIAPDGTLGGFTARGDSLVNARIGHTSVVIGRWLYVVGGATVVERAPITGTGVGTFAAVGSALSSARTRATVVVTGQRLVVAGGEAPSPLSTIEQAIIDGNGNLGSFATSSTALGSARTGASTVILGNSLYLIGGNNGAQDVATVEKATIAADGSLQAFSSVPNLTTNRRGAPTIIVDNFLYVVDGAAVASLERASIIGAHSLSAFGPDLETIDGPRTLITLGDNLYHLTGNRTAAENGVARSTISSTGVPGAFAQLAITGIPPGRNTPAVAVIGSKTYAMGGTYNSSPTTCCLVSNTVYVSNVDSAGNLGNFADAGTAMTIGREAATTIIVGNYLYVIGGNNDSGAQSSVERAQINANGTLSAFGSAGTSMATLRTLASAVLLGDKLYVIGGQSNAGAVGTIEVATVSGTTVGAFSTASVSLVAPRFVHALAVVGNQLYVFGGNNGSATITSVEHATIDSSNNLGPFSTISGLSSPSAGAAVLQNNVVVGPHIELSTLQ